MMQVTIQPLAKGDLVEADRIFRLAFSTFLGLPDRMSFSGEADIVKSRWLADPSAAFGAYGDGDDSLVGFAACHVGRGSEAKSATSTYVKFAAVRPGTHAPQRFDRLLLACEAFAAERGTTNLVAGVNTSRHLAYRTMLDRGFRTVFQGVAMQRPDEAGYNRPDCFVIDAVAGDL